MRLRTSYGLANVSSRHLPQKASSNVGKKKPVVNFTIAPTTLAVARGKLRDERGREITLPTFTKWLKWHIQTLQSIGFPTSLLV